jgi:hypothetical protein
VRYLEELDEASPGLDPLRLGGIEVEWHTDSMPDERAAPFEVGPQPVDKESARGQAPRLLASNTVELSVELVPCVNHIAGDHYESVLLGKLLFLWALGISRARTGRPPSMETGWW